MNLNMNLVADALRENFYVVQKNINNEDLTLEQARVFTGAHNFASGVIYVADGNELPQKPYFKGFCAFITIGPSPKHYVDSGCDYIEVDRKYSVLEIFNCIQDAFKLYNKWYLDMYEALSNDEGVQALIDLTQPLLGNPIYLHDPNFHFIAYSNIPGLPGGNDVHSIDKDSDKLLLRGINALKRTPYFENSFTTTKPTFHANVGEHSYIYDNLWSKGQFWGRLFVDERLREFKKGDYAIIGVLRKMLEKALFHRNILPGKHYRFLERKMIALLEGTSIDVNELEEELLLSNWKNNEDNYFCFILRLEEIDLILNTIIRNCEIIEERIPDCITFPYKDAIIGIVHVDNRSKTLKIMRDALIDFELSVGISLIFKDFSEFPLYYKQAGIALKYGIKKNSDELVYCFENFCFSYILDSCTEELPADMLFPSALHKLIEHDKKKNTNYVETLRAYLENDLSPAKAMKALYVQRSTFLYRIERIDEMTGVDFEDKKVKLHYLIAFQLMDRVKSARDSKKKSKA